ncbi:MAG: hypothetical protein JWN62_4116, partial [Acidimicrobiales bacterium]|nr:hypothetical protein [Acidimicrobiales bacterium]
MTNSEITPPVRRVLHEVGDAAPVAPSFDDMQRLAGDTSRAVPPRRAPSRRFVVAVGVIGAVIVIGVLFVSARHGAGSSLAPTTAPPATTDVSTVDTRGADTTPTTEPSSSAPTVASSASAPPLGGSPSACTANEFTVTFTDSGAAAMGNIKWIVDLTNVSGSACVMPTSA